MFCHSLSLESTIRVHSLDKGSTLNNGDRPETNHFLRLRHLKLLDVVPSLKTKIFYASHDSVSRERFPKKDGCPQRCQACLQILVTANQPNLLSFGNNECGVTIFCRLGASAFDEVMELLSQTSSAFRSEVRSNYGLD